MCALRGMLATVFVRQAQYYWVATPTPGWLGKAHVSRGMTHVEGFRCQGIAGDVRWEAKQTPMHHIKGTDNCRMGVPPNAKFTAK